MQLHVPTNAVVVPDPLRVPLTPLPRSHWQAAAGPNAKIIRVMPNTPCLVSATAAAMCKGSKVRHRSIHRTLPPSLVALPV